jgi:hypothetical protein
MIKLNTLLVVIVQCTVYTEEASSTHRHIHSNNPTPTVNRITEPYYDNLGFFLVGLAIAMVSYPPPRGVCILFVQRHARA